VSYAIVNLREIEDQASKHGFSETQEARFARRELGADTIGLSLQFVKPGKRHAFGHRHRSDEEVYVVLSGSGRVKLEDETVAVRPLDAIRVAPAVARAFEAGPDGLELLAFGTHHDGDADVVTGFWEK
jgi:uncharacterized cupin superfamily protein